MQTGQITALIDIYGDGIVLCHDCNGGYNNLHIWQNDIIYIHTFFVLTLSYSHTRYNYYGKLGER